MFGSLVIDVVFNWIESQFTEPQLCQLDELADRGSRQTTNAVVVWVMNLSLTETEIAQPWEVLNEQPETRIVNLAKVFITRDLQKLISRMVGYSICNSFRFFNRLKMLSYACRVLAEGSSELSGALPSASDSSCFILAICCTPCSVMPHCSSLSRLYLCANAVKMC